MKKVPVPAPFSIFTILFTGNWPAVCSVYLSRGQLFPVTRIILELQHIICYNEKNMLQGLAYESDNRKTAAYPVLGDGVPKINQLPLFLRGAYRFRVIEILSTSFLAAEPVEKINLAAMRKHYFKLMELSGMACAFQLNSISAYTKNKMLEEGIPFVLVGKEVYLPFLGVVLNDNVQSERTPPVRLSFMSQKLLLSALYHNVTQMTVTEMQSCWGSAKCR